jgi:DNA-directed RNA polymerase specialized sigma24 family protein
MPTGDTTPDGLALALAEREVRRLLRGRSVSREDADDLTQESLARLLANRARLETAAWPAYAVATAANLLRELERSEDVRRRHAHRLHVPDTTDGSEDAVITAEEHASLRAALAQLAPDDAALLLDHHGSHQRPSRTVPPPVAARLARVRAKLRVAYVLTHARTTLPTPRCRPVLEALSTGERRRQERLGAGRHLLVCAVCAACAPALVQRRRALAGLRPLAWTAGGAGAAWEAARRAPGRTAAASAATAGVVAAAVVTLPPDEPRQSGPVLGEAAQAEPALDVAGQSVLARLGEPELPLGPATASGLSVQDVPADEGFWVGEGPGQRLWVQLRGNGESPARVRAGDLVSFTGQVSRSSAELPERIGLPAERGAAELVHLCRYVEVRHEDLVVRRP